MKTDQSATNGNQPMTVSEKTYPARVGWIQYWPRWAPFAAVAWSLVYAALGLYWSRSGRGFPYGPGQEADFTGPIAGRFGPFIGWVIVIGAGLPAAVMGMLMLSRIRRMRLFLIIAGTLQSIVLLLLSTDMTLLIMLAYIPYVLFSFITGRGYGQTFAQGVAQSVWIIGHQLLCLVGGFLWLAATVSYARRSTDACAYCGRRDSPEGWTSPRKAARWGRIAVIVAMVGPVIYGVIRYAWALGIPLGMTREYWQAGQQTGMWVSGLFLANVGLLGAILMLGLVQRWGEVFPRWMVGLAGRRVPIALAVVPASIMAVLFMVGGISILSGWSRMAEGAAASGQNVWIVAGPTLLFLPWGAALAVATLGYYYRRRGPCGVCRRGADNTVVA